jgi:hypothetical protein
LTGACASWPPTAFLVNCIWIKKYCLFVAVAGDRESIGNLLACPAHSLDAETKERSVCPFSGSPERVVVLEVGLSVKNFTWIIVAIGALVGGPIMMLGYRKADQKPVAFGPINGALKQDWMRTGNIDFHVSAIESSLPQPIRLLVEEKRVMESAVGQDVIELRWRLATLEEGKELVVCWNTKQT